MAKIKGQWVINEQIAYTNFLQTVNFTSNGTAYASMLIDVESDGYRLGYSEYADGGGYISSYLEGWRHKRYRLVDFGDDEQDVSDTFYSWLTMNAVRADRIIGKWIFNEDVWETIGGGNQRYTEMVSFTSNGVRFSSMTVDYPNTVEVYYDNIAPYAYIQENTAGWTDEAYRTVDFGNTPQPVSGEFYLWMVTNAAQVVTVKGRWLFNQECWYPLYINTVNVNFTSNGTSYSDMSVYFESVNVAFSISYGDMLVYNFSWIDENYRLVDFGAELQYVPTEFYAWLENVAVWQDKPKKGTILLHNSSPAYPRTSADMVEGLYEMLSDMLITGGLMPKLRMPYSSFVTVPANIIIELSELQGDIEISLKDGAEGYGNEWIFTVTQGETAYNVSLPEISWQLGIAPAFAPNSVTEVRLYRIGNTLRGVWNT